MNIVQDIFSKSFNELVKLIDMDVIRPGTKEERDFLKHDSEKRLYAFLLANNIQRPAEVTIHWDRSVFGDPDEIRMEVDRETIRLLKERNLWNIAMLG